MYDQMYNMQMLTTKKVSVAVLIQDFNIQKH